MTTKVTPVRTVAANHAAGCAPIRGSGEVGSIDEAAGLDWEWALQERSAGRLDAHAGKHVVIHGLQVVAADVDVELALKRAVVATGAEPRHLAVLFVDDPTSESWLVGGQSDVR